jgi:UDP-N-acetyl-2-amino-2-deoxyglucuronate dehydrogenase
MEALMMPDQIKVGLLTHAAGAHVGAYLTALAAADGCGEVVLADPDGRWEAAARNALGDKLTHVSRDHRKMLIEQKPSMALITMEAKLAPAIVDAALDADCHVFAEKPSCVRVEDFQPLVHKADSKHRHLMLALANRTNPEIQAARELYSSDRIGKLFGVELHLIADQTRLTNASYHQQWFADKSRAGGGHLIWLGIHWLDLAMYITGESIVDVAGFTANIGGQPINIEDSAAAALRFENGALGTMTSGYYLDKGYHSHIKIWGSKGWMLIEPTKTEPLTWYTNQGADAGKIQTGTSGSQPRGYTPFLAAAIRSCADMTEAPISNQDSLRALQTVFAIYAAANGRRTEKPLAASR